ncbi:acyl carrier protein [Paenibacillus zanthoxyli]|uniref:acyl carrier protein n=1 Tax=Paenibacillus zanthoxyli TaxID=369399 RepID=UPI000471EB0D|nr:phosphopantetheine-binding protein [Paenibacillus zanthoxyli]
MTRDEIKDKVTEFLTRSMRSKELGENENIMELGLVHSLFMIQLIMFIEKNFHIEIDDEDLDLEQIGTVRDIVSLIERNQQSGVSL